MDMTMLNENHINTDWLIDILKSKKVDTKPFNHILVNEILPDDLYMSIKEFFPHVDEMDELKDGQVANSKKRYDLFIEPKAIKSMHREDLKRFWQSLYNNFLDNAELIKETLLKHSSDFFEVNGLDLDCLSFSIRLVTEELPYVMKPHLDTPLKAGVIIIYIDSDGDFECEQGGTYLFDKMNDEKGGFLPRKIYSFEENRAVIIPRVDNSWHGGRWLGSGNRQTMHIYFFKHPPEQTENIRAKFTNLI